ncbi:hypothetical protein WA538_003061, partial [Blastocystis sp. DL]
MISSFQQVQNTQFITVLANPSNIQEICFAVNPSVSIPASGIALYFSFDNGSTWSILGQVTAQAPSGIFRTGWKTMGVAQCPSVLIGISLENGDFVTNLGASVQGPVQRELPIMKVAQDLYNYITSFGSSTGGKLILPSDIMDRWLDKT